LHSVVVCFTKQKSPLPPYPTTMVKTRSQTNLPAAGNASVKSPSIKQLRAASKRAKDSDKLRNEERHRNCFVARKAEQEAAAAKYLGSLRYLGAKQIFILLLCISPLHAGLAL
jgi:hypothetical protein